MEPAKDVQELKSALSSALTIEKEGVTVKNWDAIRSTGADLLAWTVAHSPSKEARALGAWIVRNLAQQAGNGPGSINEVYMAFGRGDIPPTFTVAAINVRCMNYYFSRSIFKVAKKNDAAAVIFEIARSEMSYTDQPAYEYSCSVLCAALKENYPNPVFIQGDHFQFNAAKFIKDANAEFEGIKKIAKESIEAGFYNIDIDTSTLVELDKPTVEAQQHNNCEQCAKISDFVRSVEPEGVTVSLGGEIGEVGHKNSTVEELRAFMNGYNKLRNQAKPGLSKLSVQTGTSHGGVVLPDGTIAKVKVDFDTLKVLSEAARKEYGMGGAVQHGASTLPAEMFDNFPKMGTAEIHLATEFQNILFEHPKFTAELKAEIYKWLDKNAANERKEGETDSQFYYKTRKKAVGPFKKQTWSLPESVMTEIMKAYEERLDLLFHKLNIGGTARVIKPLIKMPVQKFVMPKVAGAEAFDGAD